MLYDNSIYGIDFKPLPYILCITNMILHDVDNPQVYHTDALSKNVRDYVNEEKFDVILMNPPYGASMVDSTKNKFPKEFASSETADLFLILITYRLKQNGRAAILLPPGIMFGTDDVKGKIKEYLLNNFNLHTIVRLPPSVFAPYTSTQTNIFFFDNNGPTKETWIYRMDMPEGYKHFSKTKPIKFEHMLPVIDWIHDKKEIYEEETDSYKAKCYSFEEIRQGKYNLELCKYQKIEDEILSPEETIANYKKQRAELNEKIDAVIKEIENALCISMKDL
jgi:type I restriction enzyme M protein